MIILVQRMREPSGQVMLPSTGGGAAAEGEAREKCEREQEKEGM